LDLTALGKFAGVALLVGNGALDRGHQLLVWWCAVDEHSLDAAALRSDQAAVEEDVELTEPALFDRYRCPKATFQLIGELFRATVIPARPTEQNPELHAATVPLQLL
jgi:hypothetical protein